MIYVCPVNKIYTMKKLNIKKYFLTTLIGALIISALIGIYLFLLGEFEETETKLLLSTLAIGWYSMTGLFSSIVYNRKNLKSFSIFGMIVSVLGLLTTVVALWDVFESKEIWKAVMIFIILTVTISHVSLLSLIRPKNNKVKYSLIATIGFIAIVALMLIKSTLNDFEEVEMYFRLLGVVSILDVLGTISVPIMNAIVEKKDENPLD